MEMGSSVSIAHFILFPPSSGYDSKHYVKNMAIKTTCISARVEQVTTRHLSNQVSELAHREKGISQEGAKPGLYKYL